MARGCLSLTALGTLAFAGCATHVDPAYQAEKTAEALPECRRVISTYGSARPGYVSLSEWAKARWDSDVAKFDKNGDGVIERDEYVKSIPGADQRTLSTLGWAFKSWDHGGKGFVNEADDRRFERAYFNRQDANSDGWLSPYECARYVPAPPCFC